MEHFMVKNEGKHVRASSLEYLRYSYICRGKQNGTEAKSFMLY